MSIANDYELLYMIQTEQDAIALEILCKKYEKLIWKYIKSYQVPVFDEDDYFQEGLILLDKAAKTFNDFHNKTFTRYFELILKRKFWALLKNNNRYVLCEDMDLLYKSNDDVSVNYILEEEENFIFDKIERLNFLEKDIAKYYFIENKNIEDISKIINKPKLSVYNTLYRIRKKFKSIR